MNIREEDYNLNESYATWLIIQPEIFPIWIPQFDNVIFEPKLGSINMIHDNIDVSVDSSLGDIRVIMFTICIDKNIGYYF